MKLERFPETPLRFPQPLSNTFRLVGPPKSLAEAHLDI